MKTVDLYKLDLINYKKIYTGLEATSYRDDNWVYKVFNDPSDIRTIEHIEKIKYIVRRRREFDKRAVFPTKLIARKDEETGYIAKNIKDSIVLANVPVITQEDIKELYYLLYDVCEILQSFHKGGVVLSDFHFHNVLVQKSDVFMIDFDNIKADAFGSVSTSHILQLFTSNYEVSFPSLTVDENTDKLSMLLSILQMFTKRIFVINLDDKVYEELSEMYPLVRAILRELKRVIKDGRIADIPLPTDLVHLTKRPKK